MTWCIVFTVFYFRFVVSVFVASLIRYAVHSISAFVFDYLSKFILEPQSWLADIPGDISAENSDRKQVSLKRNCQLNGWNLGYALSEILSAQTSDNDCTYFFCCMLSSHASEEMVAFKLFSKRKISISKCSTRSFNIVKLCELQSGKLKQTRATVFTLQHKTGSSVGTWIFACCLNVFLFFFS